jgi:hypothetical protein
VDDLALVLLHREPLPVVVRNVYSLPHPTSVVVAGYEALGQSGPVVYRFSYARG